MNDADTVDAAITNLFGNLPPEVAERVRAKYEANRAEFLTYVRNNTPSQAPAYWATKSCTKCYGRGIIGDLTKPGGSREPLVCYCVSKNYQTWLTDMRVTFNALDKRE